MTRGGFCFGAVALTVQVSKVSLRREYHRLKDERGPVAEGMIHAHPDGADPLPVGQRRGRHAFVGGVFELFAPDTDIIRSGSVAEIPLIVSAHSPRPNRHSPTPAVSRDGLPRIRRARFERMRFRMAAFTRGDPKRIQSRSYDLPTHARPHCAHGAPGRNGKYTASVVFAERSSATSITQRRVVKSGTYGSGTYGSKLSVSTRSSCSAISVSKKRPIIGPPGYGTRRSNYPHRSAYD